jgi:hypothetical protein
LSAAIIVGIGHLNVPRYVRLLREGSTTTGHVVELRPKNHDSVVVAYSVNGSDYKVLTPFVMEPNPGKHKLAIGDALIVYYLPQDPTVAALGAPRALLTNELIPIGLGAIIFPTFILWRLTRRRR